MESVKVIHKSPCGAVLGGLVIYSVKEVSGPKRVSGDFSRACLTHNPRLKRVSDHHEARLNAKKPRIASATTGKNIVMNAGATAFWSATVPSVWRIQ
jgi:hypothetical protein